MGIQTSCSLFGAGFHGANGVNPVVSLKIWQTYIIPRLTFGLEATILPARLEAELDRYQFNTMRQIQHLPKTTSRAAVHLLIGLLPIRGCIDRKILTLFGQIIRNPGTSEYAVVRRQLALKDIQAVSWVVQLREILHKYKLPSAYELMATPPTKAAWKRTIKLATADYWTAALTEEANSQSSLRYLNTGICRVGTAHHIWASAADTPFDCRRACVKAKLVTGKYPLQTVLSRFEGPMSQVTCLLCKQEPETRCHFIACCVALSSVRDQWLETLRKQLTELEQDRRSHNSQTGLPADPEDLTSFILDPSARIDQLHIHDVERTTRGMC